MVHGHVLYRGAPLQGGTIVFTPDLEVSGDGPLALAEIKADGSYALKSEEKEGALSGHYRVTIAANAPVAVDLRRAAVALPQKYCDPEQAGLKREVKAGAVNTIDFNLD